MSGEYKALTELPLVNPILTNLFALAVAIVFVVALFRILGSVFGVLVRLAVVILVVAVIWALVYR